MLTKEHRFHGQGAIKYVFRKGKSVRGELVSLKFVRNPKLNNFRMAVVVSKKVSKSAPKRNRIRRRLFEVVRTHQENIVPDVDLVFSVYDESLASSSHDNLDKEITGLLNQAGLMN